jgi:hypothetical protein
MTIEDPRWLALRSRAADLAESSGLPRDLPLGHEEMLAHVQQAAKELRLTVEIADARRTHAFMIGMAKLKELFPATDVVSQWVFQVTAVAMDLRFGDELLADAVQTEARRARRNWLFRQQVVRIYEARRPIVSLETQTAVQDWLAAHDAPFEERLDVLRAAYLPVGSSRVEQLYSRIRHRAVHYTWVGSDEFAELLASAEDASCCGIRCRSPICPVRLA